MVTEADFAIAIHYDMHFKKAEETCYHCRLNTPIPSPDERMKEAFVAVRGMNLFRGPKQDEFGKNR